MIRPTASRHVARLHWLLLPLMLAAVPLQAADELPGTEPQGAESPGEVPLAAPANDQDSAVEASGQPAPAAEFEPETEQEQSPGVANVPGAEPLSLPVFPPRSQFDEMLERPLFTSSRRPQAGETSGGSAQELRETWKLTGIVLIGEQVRAMFKERNGERRLTLGAGMPLDNNWVLDEINLQTVVMGSGDEQVTLDLLEPRDTTPIVMPEAEPEAGNTDEAAPLDERTREASRQLQQDAESAKETVK